MKIIFFGSGNFAVTILKSLSESAHQVPLVVTQPDKKKGRHLHIEGTPVKNFALLKNFPIYQPDNINTAESQNLLTKQDADVFIVVSYGKILSKNILVIPKEISVNIHASLLPKYRGAAPIQRALMAGEKETGITFIKMNEQMDEGDIILKENLVIEDSDTAISLDKKLSQLAAQTISQALSLIENHAIVFEKQDKKSATYAHIIKKEDGLIQWDSPSQQIFDKFRGCFGWPGSFTYLNKKRIKVTTMAKRENNHKAKPGEVITITSNSIEVACKTGSILIQEVLPESQKKMPIKSFLAGHPVKIGDCFNSNNMY